MLHHNHEATTLGLFAAFTSLLQPANFPLFAFSPPHGFVLFTGSAAPQYYCLLAAAIAVKSSSMQKRVNTAGLRLLYFGKLAYKVDP